jgi:hypothetical protein
VTFDESNSSQEEQVDSSIVGKEDPPCEAIKQLTIGDIRSQEGQATEEEDPQAVVAPISADVLDAEVHHTPAGNQQGGSAAPPSSAAADSTPLPGLNLEPILEQEEVEDPEDEQEGVEHPRLRQTIQQDHPVDNILGSLRKGVTTRSHLANFC